MLSYEVLCQSIADWKAGQQLNTPPTQNLSTQADAQHVEEDLVVMDDDEALIEKIVSEDATIVEESLTTETESEDA